MRALRKSTPVRRGQTLVELSLALIGAGALVAGLSSTTFIALKAIDRSNTPTMSTIEANAAIAELLTDIEFALSFSEQTVDAIAFTVPDRDGDSNPETIRYAWSGTAGDPLTRQYNGGGVVTVVENVHVFQHDLPTLAANLLSNPGMESGVTNWQAISGATVQSQSTPVYSGSGTLYAWRNTASNESGARQNVTMQLANGTQYEISAWMRKWAAPAPYDVKLQLRISSTGGGEQLFATDPFVINNSNYLEVKGTVTPTWSGTLLSAYWEATGINNIQDIYIDDAVLRPVQTPYQSISISLQVGGDSRAQIQSGVRLVNSPL